MFLEAPLRSAPAPAREGALNRLACPATRRPSARVVPLRGPARAGLGLGFPAPFGRRAGGGGSSGSRRRTVRRVGRRDLMHTTLAAQLAQLELGHLSIERIDACPGEPPDPDATVQTLGAIWSDLFALFPETALEDDAEELAWGWSICSTGRRRSAAPRSIAPPMRFAACSRPRTAPKFTRPSLKSRSGGRARPRPPCSRWRRFARPRPLST